MKSGTWATVQLLVSGTPTVSRVCELVDTGMQKDIPVNSTGHLVIAQASRKREPQQ